MISLDFSFAIAFFCVLIILILFGEWVLSNNIKSKDFDSSAEFLTQCPVCAYLFFDFQQDLISVCPRCSSYIKNEGVK